MKKFVCGVGPFHGWWTIFMGRFFKQDICFKIVKYFKFT